MLDKESLLEILNRLESPTHAGPSSELQLAALQESDTISNQFQVSFDTLEPVHVTTLHSTILQLDNDARAALAFYTALQSRMQNAILYYQRAAAALAPVNRFPAEVLAQIFLAGKHLELNFCARMSWVARRWRDVALSTPEIWSRIPVTSFFRVSVYLARSGSTPLDIEVDARTYRVDSLRFRQSMDILGQHLHRWRDLKVLLEDHDQAQLILRPLEDLCKQISDGSTTSQLASIRFGVPHVPHVISRTYTSCLAIPPTATLRVIELLGVDLACVSAAPLTAFRSLRKLSLSSVENMHLETHLFGALAAMPNIAILILDQCVFIVPRLGEDDTPDIILPKLVVLQLSLIRDETANHIFSKLHAPNLDTFEWYSRRLESPSAILNWDVLRKRYSTLSSLKLRNITSYATKHLLRWLRELRDLRGNLAAVVGDGKSVLRDVTEAQDWRHRRKWSG
ncbi:hypothetical protein FRC12_008037 [Ceratobasidium sp. 428]|nr:hypothetical protein FRC12_008037 [Ceratobasidium sp. 428]